jgi:hypothetical protein
MKLKYGEYPNNMLTRDLILDLALRLNYAWKTTGFTNPLLKNEMLNAIFFMTLKYTAEGKRCD